MLATAINPLPGVVLSNFCIVVFSLLFTRMRMRAAFAVVNAVCASALLVIIAFILEKTVGARIARSWTTGYAVQSLRLNNVVGSVIDGEYEAPLFCWLAWIQPVLVMLFVLGIYSRSRDGHVHFTIRDWFVLVALLAVIASGLKLALR